MRFGPAARSRPWPALCLTLWLAALPAFADGQTPVTIEARNQDVATIIEDLARQAGVTVALQPGVRGEVVVTITDTPFEQALTVVAAIQGYRWRLVDGVYHVGRFSDDGDPEARTEATLPLTRLDARTLARAFGYFDLDALADAPPVADLRALLPPGLDGPPVPAPEGGALMVRGSDAAVADLRLMIERLEQRSALVTFDVVVFRGTPAAVAALPVFWNRGETSLARSPGRASASAISDFAQPERTLERALAQLTVLARGRMIAPELTPARLVIADEALQLTLSLAAREEPDASLRLWLRAVIGAPENAGEVTIFVDGGRLPPEEGVLLLSEAAPGPAAPDGAEAAPLLVLVLPTLSGPLP